MTLQLQLQLQAPYKSRGDPDTPVPDVEGLVFQLNHHAVQVLIPDNLIPIHTCPPSIPTVTMPLPLQLRAHHIVQNREQNLAGNVQ